jgi:hypothetical protein
MTRRRAFARMLALAVGLAALPPAGALAAGGPPGVYTSAGEHGIVSPDGRWRYVTLPTGKAILLAQIATDGGRIVDQRRIQGFFEVPAVALDLSPEGISADGRTLVLTKPYIRFKQSHTKFMLYEADPLKSPRRLKLRGAFTFDAISPDGSTLYLTQYESKIDPTAYAIRAYDVNADRLLRRPVIDPTEPEEEMRGFPVTRAASPDGRWAYTLYDGSGGGPFIHALDTVKGTARCVDLDALADLPPRLIHRLDLQVSPDGDTLAVNDGRGPVAAMDATTFVVTTPGSATSGSDGSDGPPWTLLVVAGFGAVAVAAAIRALLRRRIAAT